MKRSALILLFALQICSAQKFYTNEPGIVYPAMEKFIAENYANDNSILEKLQELDSIIIQRLEPEEMIDGKVFFRYGVYHPWESTKWIEIDPFVVKYPQLFEAVFIHELGHFLGLDHTEVKNLSANDPKRNEIMAKDRPDYIKPDEWERVRESYYTELHKLIMPKVK